MFNKKLFIALIALLVISNVVYGKKSKKNKRPKDQEDFTTIQPNVVAYSTFGFNDVGAYDGFVPTSPDYATLLNSVNQESTTRLYAPAFPSSLDSTGFGNYGSQAFDSHSYSVSEDNMEQPGMLQYTSSSMNFFSNPNFGTTAEQNKNTDSDDTNGQLTEDPDAPVYGTKINSRHKYRGVNPHNNTEFSNYNNGYSNLSDGILHSNFPNAESAHESKPAHSEPHINYQNNNGYVQNYESQENEDFGKPSSSSAHNILKFPRVVDFTKSKQYYPTELDTSKFLLDINQPLTPQNSMTDTQMETTFSTFNYNNNNNNNKFIDSSPKLVDYNLKNNEESSDKSVIKSNSFFDQDITYNHVNSRHKHSTKNPEQKKKIKNKPWTSGNYSNDFNNWKDSSSVKGYGYSTNYSNMNFKYDVSESKKPYNYDEIVPASSNLVDLTNYQYPESDYTNFKKMPEFNEEDEYTSVPFRDKSKVNDYLNQFKNSYSTVPTTTSYWGNVFKSTDYSSFRDHPKKSHYGEINSDTVVNIPKRPQKLSLTKPSENKQIDWPPVHHSRPHRFNKPTNDWAKDLYETRYKSEEDLLGLRTHDTSHPAYLPTYKPSDNVFDNDNEFKSLIEKWRQSYLKTKYKDVPVRDYESYGSEVKPMHMPIPKPYPIEVPHPVIVPVPRPFPVRVPVSRPVAVPVVRELTVSIEKPVPYPVYKNVPYPVEKLIPVPVEKEVAVPVEKPYPVHIPYVRPVFHHTKPVHEDPEEEDDFMRRPEAKKPSQFKKRPYGIRNRSRRPSRASYQDRNRRRWPDRRHPSGYNTEHRHHPRPKEFQHSPHKYHDIEPEDDEENSDYALYCRRTGHC